MSSSGWTLTIRKSKYLFNIVVSRETKVKFDSLFMLECLKLVLFSICFNYFFLFYCR
ncbi:hypothetical protein E2C01_039269 [Portunus trituberculatus]|uniref:Uncharacterized protein n=1 Tax=Portunus trituberculatus TaxID=210409 RepID=A0A5B7FJE8_PORTR|nr:hypothetical protein [Portunus trituberculatus]